MSNVPKIQSPCKKIECNEMMRFLLALTISHEHIQQTTSDKSFLQLNSFAKGESENQKIDCNDPDPQIDKIYQRLVFGDYISVRESDIRSPLQIEN